MAAADLKAPASHIYEAVLNRMQEADEIGGPEGQDYIDLMEAIAAEATQRADACRANLTGQYRDPNQLLFALIELKRQVTDFCEREGEADFETARATQAIEAAMPRHANGTPMYSTRTIKDNGDPIMLNDLGMRSVFCDIADDDGSPA